MKVRNIHQYSRLTDKGPSIAECVIRTIRNLLKKSVFEKVNASWITELSSVVKQYINTIHHSVKMTSVQASKKVNEKVVLDNLHDGRIRQNQNLTWEI